MRLFSRIFFILSLLSVLCALSPHPIYALACSGTGYTCRKFDCAVNEIEDTSRYCTNYDYICCKKVPTSTPKPTSTPQPSDTPIPFTSPTVTPAGGCKCQNGKCVGNLTKCTYTVVGCPQTCSDPAKNATIEEYCTTTNETCGIKPCAGYSASCVSNCKKGAPGCVAITVPADCAYNAPGCNVCGYARTEAIYCNGVHCGDTCVPHALCSNSPWCSGSGNPTNTPAPIPNPSSVYDPFSPKKTKISSPSCLRVLVVK
jgi:hypothetical protein